MRDALIVLATIAYLVALVWIAAPDPTPDARRAMCHALGHEWTGGACYPRKPEVR